MKASDIMTSPAVTVDPNTTVKAIANLLYERRISGVPVVEDGRLVGLVSEADLLRREAAVEPYASTASDVMTREVATVEPDTPVAEVAALLETRRIKRVPVLREKKVVGIVSRSNLVQALAVEGPPAEARPDDGAIRAALLAELEREPWWRQAESNIIVTGGVVHYWGRLDSEAQRHSARTLAQRVPGVRGVEDHRLRIPETPARPAEAPTGVRPASSRGHSQHGGVDSYHSFSFGNYYDPAHSGYGPLRVLNEKVVQPGKGSTTYGVQDVEIVTYVLQGALGHDDSLDNAVILSAGGVQRLSAGSGARFSEINRSEGEPCHLLQMWLEPDRLGLPASYDHKRFSADEKRGRLRIVASPDGRDGSLQINQNALLYAGLFDGAERAELEVGRGRKSYVHVARGRVTVNGHVLKAGDALKTLNAKLSFESGAGAEVLVFDV